MTKKKCKTGYLKIITPGASLLQFVPAMPYSRSPTFF